MKTIWPIAITALCCGLAVAALTVALRDKTVVHKDYVDALARELRSVDVGLIDRETKAEDARQRLESRVGKVQKSVGNLEARILDLTESQRRLNRDLLRSELALVGTEITREQAKSPPSRTTLDFLELRARMLQQQLQRLRAESDNPTGRKP